MRDIIIIGSGWYGCHIALFLKKYGYEVTIIEKNKEIFNNSSFYNQNRLHLGFHYPRNYSTRSLCKNNFDKFSNKYKEVIDTINNNYYLISNESIIDYDTYEHIYKYENIEFDILQNNIFNNIHSNIIKVKEEVINSDKSKHFLLNKLNEQKIPIIFNTEVFCVRQFDEKVQVDSLNNNYTCDLLLDCTYNQLGLLTENYEYELTISLLFKKVTDVNFDAITIMDGKFLSLYPRNIEENIYTLTDVEYTPIIKSTNYNDIKDYIVTEEKIEIIKKNMIKKCKYYYPEFEENFKYISYFLSKKTKKISQTDSRDINIEEINDNIVSVNCGKIYGIFDFEKYIKKKLNL